jgi:hypothetical protein
MVSEKPDVREHVLDVSSPVRLYVGPSRGDAITPHDVAIGDVTFRAMDSLRTCTVRLIGTPEVAGASVVSQSGEVIDVLVPRGLSPDVVGLRAVDVVVELPAGSSIDVSTPAGSVRTIGTLAAVEASSGSGDIVIDDVTGDVRLTTGTGSVDVASAGAAHVLSGSGNVALGLTRGAVRVRTGSGDAHINGSGCSELDVETASGDIEILVARGGTVEVDCSSVTGRVSSPLESKADPGPHGPHTRVRVRTASGDVDVRRV